MTDLLMDKAREAALQERREREDLERRSRPLAVLDQFVRDIEQIAAEAPELRCDLEPLKQSAVAASKSVWKRIREGRAA